MQIINPAQTSTPAAQATFSKGQAGPVGQRNPFANLLQDKISENDAGPEAALSSSLSILTMMGQLIQATSGTEESLQEQLAASGKQLVKMLNRSKDEGSAKMLSSDELKDWLALAMTFLSAYFQPAQQNGLMEPISEPPTLEKVNQVLQELQQAGQSQPSSTAFQQTVMELKALVDRFQSSDETAALSDKAANNHNHTVGIQSASPFYQHEASYSGLNKGKKDGLNPPVSVMSVPSEANMQPKDASKLGIPFSLKLGAPLGRFFINTDNPVDEPVEPSNNDAAAPIISDSFNSVLKGAAIGQSVPESIKGFSGSVNVQQFADEMARLIVKNMKISTVNGVSEAKITLHPQELGQVDVRISTIGGQLMAHFATETLAGKDAIEAQLAQLRNTLAQQGFQVEKLQVTYGTAGSLFQQQQQRDQSQAFGQQQKAPKHRSISGINDYDSLLTKEMDVQGLNNKAVYGSTFHATA